MQKTVAIDERVSNSKNDENVYRLLQRTFLDGRIQIILFIIIKPLISN